MTPTHHRPRWLERHWRPAILLALVALAVAGGYAIQASYHNTLEHLHTSQLEACERGNVLRQRLQVNVRVLDLLLAEAARARTVTAHHTESPQVRSASVVELTVGPLRDNRRPLARVRVTHGQRLVATAPVTRTPDWAALACLAAIAGPHRPA